MILIMRLNPDLIRAVRLAVAAVCVVTLGLLAVGCGGDDAASAGGPRIVVTTAPLGALVRDVVGDRARVDVLIPSDLDPHDFQPSAKDAQRLADADLVVVSGAGLEGGLQRSIDQARDGGTPVFDASQHVRLRTLGEGDHEGEDAHEHEGGHAHDHGAEDPHFWLDPMRMGDVAVALAPAVRDHAGIDVADRAQAVRSRMASLTRELTAMIAAVPEARRVLVTGHDSLGYLAARFHLRVVGAVIPSLSTQAEPSAAQVARVIATIRQTRAPAIFTEVGTPKAVVDAISSDTGARVVPLNTHAVAADGSYASTMREMMTAIVTGLSAK